MRGRSDNLAQRPSACHGVMYGQAYRQGVCCGLWAKGSSPQNGRLQMLKCQICKEQVEILAHQIRDGKTVDACLDCADRYYQWFLTQELIASEKRGA